MKKYLKKNDMKKKIIFICNNFDFFFNTRFQLANEIAKKLNIKVYCLTNLKNSKNIKIKNVNFINFDIDNNSLSFFKEVKTFISFYKFIIKDKDSIYHFVSLKPIIYGLIISKLFRLKKTVFSFSGLGYFFNTKYNSVLTNFFKFILKTTINKNQKFVFHNRNDYELIKKFSEKLSNKMIKVTYGSGVDLKLFKKIKKEKFINKKIIFIGRILYDKGIFDLLNAIEILNNKRNDFKFYIMGNFDEKNPSGINKNFFLNKIKKIKNIKYIGYKKKVHKEIYKYSSVILPSHHEGAPKTILESAAAGRLIFASNIPGCKTLIRNNIDGILFKKNNPKDLAKKINKTFENVKKINILRNNAQLKAKKYFSIENVIEDHKKIYLSLR